MLKLSPLTKSLIEAYAQIDAIKEKDYSEKLEVSKTVSFFGSFYEKMRNAVEYRESHLVRKATIERILRRRLLLNQKPEDFSESLVRELLWGKYLPQNSVTENVVKRVTQASNRYLYLRHQITAQLQNIKQMNEVSDWIIQLLACKIEYILVPNARNQTFTDYIYRWLRPSIELIDEESKNADILVYLATHEAFNKADDAILRYQYIKLYGEENLFSDFWKIYIKINECVRHPQRAKISKFLRKQNAPFLILKALLSSKSEKSLAEELTDEKVLEEKITKICQQKYTQVNSRLRRAAIRSIIYLFLTKMLFALLLEIPLDRYFQQGELTVLPLAVNLSFPPVLMFFIALFITVPGKDNTERIIKRIKEILTQERPSMPKKAFASKARVGKPLLTFIFTIIYALTFILIFGLIVWGLTLLGFNFISQLVFLFFLTAVSFFGYRIKQIPKEYRFQEKEGLLSPVADFFMLPILSVGKWLSQEIARINIFTFIFDFILEAPFKAIFEVFEEWFRFLRSKREEIV